MASFPARSCTFFRVGPAELAKPQCFAVKRGEVSETRWDADLHHPDYSRLIGRVNALPDTALISEIIGSPLTSGFAAGQENRAQPGEDSVPQIRPTQILLDGEIDLSEAYGIRVQDVSDRNYIRHGEVLFNNTNSTALVGKSAVFRESVPAVCSNHVTRLRLREGIEPEFVEMVLNWLQQSGYFARLCTNFNNQAGVNTETLSNVRIPFPTASKRKELVTRMLSGRSERKEKLVGAEALLVGLDGVVMDALGLVALPQDSRRAFAVRHQVTQQRFDSHFHSPEFARVQQMLSQTKCEPLGSITAFSKETWRPQDHDQPTFRYIEIAMVDPKTGEAHWNNVPTDEAPSRARMRIRADDLIVSLTRPHHGSIAHLGPEFEGCVASTGFAVIRDVASHVHRDYLWCVLRARMCLSQMIQRSSGGNYPAITEAELRNILVPVPDQNTQYNVAAEAVRRLEEARRLRAEAEGDWEKVKRWFGAQLIGMISL